MQARPGRLALLKDIFLFCFLFLVSFQLPWEPPLSGHDLGAQAALEYWSAHGYQYGTQIVQNVGPLGFIGYPELYAGFLDREKFLLNLLVSAVFIGLVIALARKLPSTLGRAALLVSTALFSSPWFVTPYDTSDARFYLLMLFIAYALFMDMGGARALYLFPVLALLSLAKGTLLFIAVAITALSALHYVISGRIIRAGGAAAFYAACLTLFWLASGQQIGHLPLFIGNMMGFTNGYAVGYTEAMAYFEPLNLTVSAITVMLVAVTVMALRHARGLTLISREQQCSRAACIGLELFILFIVWKHSIVRADGHMMVLFYFVLVALPVFFWLPPLYAPAVTRCTARRTVAYGVALMLSLGGFSQCLFYIEGMNVSLFAPALLNAHFLSHTSDYFSYLDSALTRTERAFALPHTKALVGGKPIGYFGFEPEPMLYNGFDYRPMPKTISFTGWNHASMEEDAAFYRDGATAPLYLLYRQASIDNHMSGQDEALAQLEIFKAYEPVVGEAIAAENKGNILLKHRDSAGAIAHNPLGSRMAALGDWVTVPVSASPVRVKIEVEKNLPSALLRTFYKAPEYIIDYVTDDAVTHTKRFMPVMAEDGFLVAPLITNNRDFIAAMYHDDYNDFLSGKNTTLHRMVKLRIACRHLAFACPAHFHVGFETVEGLELGRVAGAAPAIWPATPGD